LHARACFPLGGENNGSGSSGPVYQLREPQVSYLADFGLENDAIGVKNTYFWNVY